MTPQPLNRPCGVDVLSVMDEHIADCEYEMRNAETAKYEALCAKSLNQAKQARAAVAELHRLVLSIDDECGNAKPNFGRVVKLAAEAAALARVGGAA